MLNNAHHTNNTSGNSNGLKSLVPVSIVYFLGAFNDNFYKQAAMLIAVSSGLTQNQGYAVTIFTLPFLVFAAPAGWLADRIQKRKVIIISKWAELFAMISGAAGLITGSWPLIFIMLAIMATQTTVFSPAVNGYLPELFPEEKIVRVNGILRMIVTTAILSGIALAGPALDSRVFGKGEHTAGFVVIMIAIIGIIFSYFIPGRPSTPTHNPFPWKGPFETLKILIGLRNDKLLFFVIICDVFIWFSGSLQILLLNPLGLNEFHLTKTSTSLIIATELLGLAFGGITSSIFAKGPKWYRVIIPAGFLLSFSMMSIPFIGSRLVLHIVAVAMGFATGLFMIPLESFIQIRPASGTKGTVWASGNFAVFGGIMLSGFLANVLDAHFLPSKSFLYWGIFSLLIISIISIYMKRSKLE